ncbi:MAG TPA: spermidine/putrescine ABC transporter substrate-binding protein [Anaerolineales bacterium]|nr:spermidine/putrescine ABC transporter substrate-binding protein [Anaerolineales bacterium]
MKVLLQPKLLTTFSLVVATSVILTACGGASKASPTATAGDSTGAVTSERCGDPSKLADKLSFFNWSDYLAPELLDMFEEECGVKVVQDTFSNNEDMIAKVQAGNSGYDLVVPSDYAVQIMVNRGLLAELTKENLPNLANVNPANLGMYFDPENKYSVPYQWGTTAIIYNSAKLEEAPTSWAAIFEPDQICKYKGYVSLLDDEREALGAALKYLGYSYNDVDPAHHEEAKQLLLAQKDCLAGYSSDIIPQLAAEEILLAQGWPGQLGQARVDNPDLKYVFPSEGFSVWQDNLSIPVDAPNPYTAEIFINWLMDSEIAAINENYIFYFTPVQTAEDLLSDEYKEIMGGAGLLEVYDHLDRAEWIERNDKTVIFSDTWTAVRAK